MINFTNILRGPVTSVAGLIIVVATVYAVLNDHIQWVWTGLITAGLGLALLFIPDKLGSKLEKVIDKETDKL